MKTFALLLCSLGLLFAQTREGNFDIRVEPFAKLQTGVQVPFTIHVKDALGKPLPDAKVTLQIETPEHTKAKIFAAPAIETGTYMAKPVFPSAGEWNIYVEVHRGDQMSARTLQFTVSD